MINYRAIDFLESLLEFNDAWIKYNNKEYFIRQPELAGDETNEYYNMFIFDEDINELIFEVEAETKLECLEKFTKLPIIDGKTFYEIEMDMEVIF
jgi:hypothetical protein